MIEVKNEGNDISRYRYGHDGERVIKQTPDGQTVYVNEYFTVRAVIGADGSQAVRSRVATKHIFAGSERIATKRVDPTGTKLKDNLVNRATADCSPAQSVIGYVVDVFMRDSSAGCPPINTQGELLPEQDNLEREDELYYYHTDHLGSVGLVTKRGELHDYSVFLPFGEQWVFQSANQAAYNQAINGEGLNPLSPFQFTGKELDKFTGLTYFGARYYDPRMSVWMSTDPIVNDYLGSNPDDLTNAGMFNSRNMNIYSYAYNNPVNLIDPDGNFVVGVEIQGDITIDVTPAMVYAAVAMIEDKIGIELPDKVFNKLYDAAIKGSKVRGNIQGAITRTYAVELVANDGVDDDGMFDFVDINAGVFTTFEVGLEGSVSAKKQNTAAGAGVTVNALVSLDMDANLEDLTGGSTQKNVSANKIIYGIGDVNATLITGDKNRETGVAGKQFLSVGVGVSTSGKGGSAGVTKAFTKRE